MEMTYSSIILFLALPFFLAGCNKDSTNTSNSIEGSWELVRISGSRPIINYPAGNGNVLKFTNSTYEAFENGSLEKRGTYTIVEDNTVETNVCLDLPDDQFRDRIIYDNDNRATKSFLQISNDTLSFISGCFAVDAGSRTEYVRK